MTEDWRLENASDERLRGRSFRFAEWWPIRDGWDHDHCEACFARFRADAVDDALTSGWVTADDSMSWICEECFADSRARCGWREVGERR